MPLPTRWSIQDGEPSAGSQRLAGSIKRTQPAAAVFKDCRSDEHLRTRQNVCPGDASTNSFRVAMLTFGEGWHNNHHAAPQSARHGLAWYEFDLNWYGITALRRLGLAWDIKLARLNPSKDT